MKFEIKSYWTGSILFSLETESMKLCLEAAVKQKTVLRDADLSGADLSDADLSGADLRGADLSDADLSGAVLRGADLSDADLSGAVLRGADLRGADLDVEVASDKQAIENLDRVREIILDDAKRLHMDHWHADDGWVDRTCAIEATCGTTHCLAGWLQVCSTDEKIRKMTASVAGVVLAPVASRMFYKTNEEVLEWLNNREYAK